MNIALKTLFSRNILLGQFKCPNYITKIRLSSEETFENGEYRAFKERAETLQQLKSRLVYQSRKRGILENDLLLSTFISKHLPSLTEEQLHTYDRLINLPSNEWDLYYWATEAKPTPKEFESDVMNMFKIHVKNLNREARIRQPNLY